jgi:hypothetical protein
MSVTSSSQSISIGFFMNVEQTDAVPGAVQRCRFAERGDAGGEDEEVEAEEAEAVGAEEAEAVGAEEDSRCVDCTLCALRSSTFRSTSGTFLASSTAALPLSVR